MNWYGLHIGDWLKKTQELTILQEGVYLRLLNWCYANELPLPVKRTDISRIVRATSRHERQAIEHVLSKHFELQADGWHNARCDRELQKRGSTSTVARQHQTAVADRQKKTRAKRHQLVLALNAAGIETDTSVSIRELEALCVTHNVTRDKGSDEQRDGVTRHSEITLAQPTTNNHTSLKSDVSVTASVTPTRAGAACLAMRKAGLGVVSPNDPRLLALLEAGVGDDELAIAAHEASLRGKSFAWALAAVAGRMRDAKQLADGLSKPPERARSAAELSAEAWAPTLFANATEGR